MALRCTVCDHPERNAIDEAIRIKNESERIVANRHGLTQAAVHRHKAHIPARLAKAAQRNEIRDADEFLDHVRLMMGASVKGVQLGQAAAAKLADDPATLYKMTPAFMAQGLRAAELLGQATGRLNNQAAPAGGNIYLSVILPRELGPAPAPAIETTAVEVHQEQVSSDVSTKR